ALDAIPRISRAQSLDVLSALSNVAGYRAVVEAAAEFGGMFSSQVTAAGTTPPATVFVIGAGVAGLAAIGAASSLGAQVRAFDVRPEAAEQIESMGATVVRADAAAQQVSTDGYASALTADQEAAALRAYAAETARADVVITTALVRGTAPTTVTAEMVAAMRPGSVVVDLAAPGGGNCELTVPGERVVSDDGVVVLGYTDLPDRMPRHTSELLGTAVANLLALVTPGRDGRLVLDLDDVVVRGMTVATGGEVLWPPPPVAVSAGTTPEPAAPTARAPRRPHRGRRGARCARRRRLARRAGRALHGAGARGRRRVLRDLARHARPAHAAHVPDQRDLRDHPGRRHAADRLGRPGGDHARRARLGRREHQHLRRVPRDAPHARHVPAGPRPGGRGHGRGCAMTAESVVQALYLVAGVLFVLSLAGLSRQETARRGAALGMAGMGLALAATVALSLARSERPVGVTAALILLVLLVGAAVGTWRARTVEMTQMPELIALLHSFVGAAAVLVGFGSYLG